MNPGIAIRSIRDGEEEAVCGIVRASFDPYVGYEYSPDGVTEFYKYANSMAMAERLKGDYFVLVAAHNQRIVGMIEFRGNEHLSMLFVEPSYLRQGIARALFEESLALIRKADQVPRQITVNSSRYAAPVYESFGFVTSGPEQTVKGMTFIPMRFTM